MEITSFKVFVGSGEFILCKATSEAIPIVIQGISFVVDLHHLDIVGADMVFGVAWMRSVGRILIDYDRLTIEFILQGQHVSWGTCLPFGNSVRDLAAVGIVCKTLKMWVL